MKRLTIVFTLCAAAILALAPSALAQQGADLDCSQIGTPGANPTEVQAQAQAIFDADPGDPNALDSDGDGIACEFEASPSGEVTFEDGTGFVTDAVAPTPEDDELNCEDFASQAEAQAVLDADMTDPNELDVDADGVACNEVISAPPTQATGSPTQYQKPESPSVEVAPVTPRPNADGPVFQPTKPDVAETSSPAPLSSSPRPSALQELPATGGLSLLIPGLTGAALLIGLGGLAGGVQSRRT